MSQGLPECASCLLRDSQICDACEDGDHFEEDFEVDPDEDDDGFGFDQATARKRRFMFAMAA